MSEDRFRQIEDQYIGLDAETKRQRASLITTTEKLCELIERTAALEVNMGRAFKRIEALEEEDFRAGDTVVITGSGETADDFRTCLDPNPASRPGWVELETPSGIEFVIREKVRAMTAKERSAVVIEPDKNAGVPFVSPEPPALPSGSRVTYRNEEWEVVGSYMGYCVIGRDLGNEEPFLTFTEFDKLEATS